MTEERSIAAIDVGSNGMRILIGTVSPTGRIRETRYERLAVRLGGDTFSDGRLREETIAAAVGGLERFAALMTLHGVTEYRAVATSATREASNGDTLVDRIRVCTGIDLEIIGGLEEAQLIFSGASGRIDLRGKSALLIDMGGGSVEVTVARDGNALGCETLPIGPVRMLRNLQQSDRGEASTPEMLERYSGRFEQLIRAELEDEKPAVCVGSGGNVERLAKLRVSMLGKSKTGKVKLGDLESLIPRLLATPVEKRVSELGMRPDRADVIAIAALILHHVMDEAAILKVVVPGIGLKDGLLSQLARRVGPARQHEPGRAGSA